MPEGLCLPTSLPCKLGLWHDVVVLPIMLRVIDALWFLKDETTPRNSRAPMGKKGVWPTWLDVDDHLESEIVNRRSVDKGKEIGLGLERKYRFKGVG